jgi:hypothetical protein
MSKNDNEHPDELVIAFRRFLRRTINDSPDPKDRRQEYKDNKYEIYTYTHAFFLSL